MNNGLLRTKLHITHKGNPIAFFSVFQHNIETSLAVCPQVWKERQEMMMILASLETFTNLSFLSTFQLVSYMIICFRSGDGEWGSGAFACCFSVPVERPLPTPHPPPRLHFSGGICNACLPLLAILCFTPHFKAVLLHWVWLWGFCVVYGVFVQYIKLPTEQLCPGSKRGAFVTTIFLMWKFLFLCYGRWDRKH